MVIKSRLTNLGQPHLHPVTEEVPPEAVVAHVEVVAVAAIDHKHLQAFLDLNNLQDHKEKASDHLTVRQEMNSLTRSKIQDSLT